MAHFHRYHFTSDKYVGGTSFNPIKFDTTQDLPSGIVFIKNGFRSQPTDYASGAVPFDTPLGIENSVVTDTFRELQKGRISNKNRVQVISKIGGTAVLDSMQYSDAFPVLTNKDGLVVGNGYGFCCSSSLFIAGIFGSHDPDAMHDYGVVFTVENLNAMKTNVFVS